MIDTVGAIILQANTSPKSLMRSENISDINLIAVTKQAILRYPP